MLRGLTINELSLVSGGAADYAQTIKDNFGDNIKIVNITPAEFDSCLGIPQENEICLMLAIPGAIVEATRDGLPLTIHVTDCGHAKVKS